MTYIGRPQIEELLRKLPLLRGLVANMQIELRQLRQRGESDTLRREDIFLSKIYGNKGMSDMPHSERSPGDKELDIIQEKDRIIEDEVHRMDNAVNTVLNTLEKVENAFKALKPHQQTVLTEFYCEGKTWAQIASIMYMERSSLQGIRDDALETIALINRISFKDYEFCMGELVIEKEGDKQ